MHLSFFSMDVNLYFSYTQREQEKGRARVRGKEKRQNGQRGSLVSVSTGGRARLFSALIRQHNTGSSSGTRLTKPHTRETLWTRCSGAALTLLRGREQEEGGKEARGRENEEEIIETCNNAN